MKYETHADWCEHLAELGALKEEHNVCILADCCLAEATDGEG